MTPLPMARIFVFPIKPDGCAWARDTSRNQLQTS